jgi:hypothetical protein
MVPSFLRTTVYKGPAETSTTLPSPDTRVGNGRGAVVPSPTCPWSLAPQAQTLPSTLTGDAVGSAAGDLRDVVEPGHGHGLEAAAIGFGDGAVAQLAGVVRSPRPHAAIGGTRHRVIRARRDLDRA